MICFLYIVYGDSQVCPANIPWKRCIVRSKNNKVINCSCMGVCIGVSVVFSSHILWVLSLSNGHALSGSCRRCHCLTTML